MAEYCVIFNKIKIFKHYSDRHIKIRKFHRILWLEFGLWWIFAFNLNLEDVFCEDLKTVRWNWIWKSLFVDPNKPSLILWVVFELISKRPQQSYCSLNKNLHTFIHGHQLSLHPCEKIVTLARPANSVALGRLDLKYIHQSRSSGIQLITN